MINFLCFIQQYSLLILLCCLVCVLPIYNDRGSSKPSIFEKFVVVTNYVCPPPGLVGFVCLISNVIKGGRISPFLQYHIFQAFFLVMLYCLLGVFLNLITGILAFIPIIKDITNWIVTHTVLLPVIGSLPTIITLCILLLMVYLVITSIQGQYSYIPWVSDIIKRNVRR